MTDINLLPEELRNNNPKNGASFDLDDVEFTSGEELNNNLSNDGRLVSDKRKMNWFGDKMENAFNGEKENVRANSDREKLSLDDLLGGTKKPSIKITENKKSGGFFSGLFNKKDSSEENIVMPEKNVEQNQVGTNLRPNFVNNNLNKEQSLSADQQKSQIIDKKIVYDNIPEKKPLTSPLQNIGPTKDKFSFSAWFKKIANTEEKNVTDGSGKIDVNLLPSSGKSNTLNPFFVLASYLLISVVLVCVIYFGVYIYKTKTMSQNGDLDKELQNFTDEVSAYNNVISDLQSWQDKAQKINNLFEKHIYWSKFFKSIEKNTLPNVSYSNFSGGLNGNLSLAATAPDYQTVVKQWMYLRGASDFAKNVIITGATMSKSNDGKGGGVSFSITLDLADDIFYYKNK